MGWFKKVADKVRAPIKKVAAPVTKTVQKLTAKGPLKAVKLVGRKAAAVAAPFSTSGLGAFVQPKVLGITNAQNAKLFDRSQQATRIVAAAVGAYVAAPAVGSSLASMGGAVKTTALGVGSKIKNFLFSPQTKTPNNGEPNTRVGDLWETALDMGSGLLTSQEENAFAEAGVGGWNAGAGDAVGQRLTSGISPWVWVAGAGAFGLIILLLVKGKG